MLENADPFRIDDGLSGIKKPLYRLTKGRKIRKTKTGGKLIRDGLHQKRSAP
jgi:hypothetical protein